jgi:hypothetical protein
MSKRTRYPSDLTDRQWDLLRPFDRAGLVDLRRAGVDADDVPPGADQLGEQGAHQADAASQVGDAHPAPQPRFEEHAPRARP